MKEYFEISKIKEKELGFYELENFISFNEREKYNFICEEYIKTCENYIIATIIKILRKKLSLTQKQLGELIGKKEITIRKYESGNTNISESILYSIMKKLKIEDLYFIQNEINFFEDSNIGLIIENFYDAILSLESLKFIDDIQRGYIKGEVLKKINFTIEKLFINEIPKDDFYLLFSEYSKKFQFLKDDEKEKLSYDLKNYLEYLNFKYKIK